MNRRQEDESPYCLQPTHGELQIITSSSRLSKGVFRRNFPFLVDYFSTFGRLVADRYFSGGTRILLMPRSTTRAQELFFQNRGSLSKSLGKSCGLSALEADSSFPNPCHSASKKRRALMQSQPFATASAASTPRSSHNMTCSGTP
jgi:hypothetical protein